MQRQLNLLEKSLLELEVCRLFGKYSLAEDRRHKAGGSLHPTARTDNRKPFRHWSFSEEGWASSARRADRARIWSMRTAPALRPILLATSSADRPSKTRRTSTVR